MDNLPRVVIVGAGFGGLQAARALRGKAAHVLIIDRNNFHTFQPLLYQVATAALDAGEVAHQVRSLVRRQANLEFLQGSVWSVDWGGKQVRLEDGSDVAFDYLVMAAGAVTNDFGIPGVAENAYTLKSLDDALELRSHILRQFERANAHPELIEDGLLNFVVAGGGPSGVELAGALAELLRQVLPADYPNLDLTRARVILLEAQESVLGGYGDAARVYARRALLLRGVELRLTQAVSEVKPGVVRLSNGDAIITRTLVWAAGVKANPLVQVLDAELTRGGRVKVENDLTIPGRPYAFVVGDLAGFESDRGRLLPQIAPVAMQQGRHVADQIARRIDGKESRPFRYADKGAMAIIGRNAGVAQLPARMSGLAIRGLPGWLAWGLVHLHYLPGHRNRFAALVDWTYNYFTRDRHARLITSPGRPGELEQLPGEWFEIDERPGWRNPQRTMESSV